MASRSVPDGSLEGLKQGLSHLDPRGSYKDLQGAMCQFNRWHTIFENLKKSVLG